MLWEHPAKKVVKGLSSHACPGCFVSLMSLLSLEIPGVLWVDLGVLEAALRPDPFFLMSSVHGEANWEC